MNNRNPLSFLSISSSFVVLSLSLALMVITAGNSVNKSTSTVAKASLTDVSISLIPTSPVLTFDAKTDQKLALVVQGEKPVSTLSVQVSFDPQMVEVSPKVQDGKVFDQDSNVTVDNKKGTISFYASNTVPKVINSSVATIVFKTKNPGEARFVLQAGATSDGIGLSTKLVDATIQIN